MLNELAKFNPELLMKDRLLAISKSDLLDEELKLEIEKTLPNLPHVFISSLTKTGLMELKDMIWRQLNKSDE